MASVNLIPSPSRAANLLRALLLNAVAGAGVDLIANADRSIQTIDGLRAYPKPALDAGRTLVVSVQEYAAGGGIGGGRYRWQANSSIADDGGAVINPTGNAGTGRWVLIHEGSITLAQYGVVPDTGVDQKAALQNAFTSSVARSLKLVDGGGTYDVVNEAAMTIPSNLDFRGDRHRTVLRVSNPLKPMAVGTAVSKVSLVDHTVTALGTVNPASDRAYWFKGCSDITVSVRAVNYKNVFFNSATGVYGTTNAAGMNYRVNADNNQCLFPDATPANQNIPPVFFCYCDGFQAIGGEYINSGNGPVWWGGDSSFLVDGALTNQRKCRNGRISGCRVQNTAAPIWGSMGEGIAVVGNTIRDYADVGLDAEGSFDVVFAANTVMQTITGNGAMSTFSGCRDVRFIGNQITITTAQPAYRNYNTSQDQTNSIGTVIAENKIRCLSGVATLDAAAGAAGNITVSRNKLFNVVIDMTPNGQGDTEIIGNESLIDFALIADTVTPVKAIRASAFNYGPTSNQIKVKGNQLSVRGTAVPGSIGIEMLHANPNTQSDYTAFGNEIGEFPIHISTKNTSTNQPGVFLVEKNRMRGTPVIERVETGAQVSSRLLVGNQDVFGRPFPAALPTAGTWDAGQVIELHPPVAGGISRYKNVTKGTFGGGTVPNFRTDGVLS